MADEDKPFWSPPAADPALVAFRRQFDAARDPQTARNALGILDTGSSGGAPLDAEYITAVDDPTLPNDRALTDTATITWDFSTPGQAKASTAAGGGNVSNTGTPTSGQYARWTSATVIAGVAPATVLSDIGAQPLDADLTAIAALTGTNTIYYRSASNVWSPVTVSTGLSFTGGVLTATGGGGGAPTGAEYIVGSSDATLSAERVLTDSATVTWDLTIAGQAKANATAGAGGLGVGGQCRLSRSATSTLKLSPYDGNQIFVNGALRTIPSAGVTFTLTGLTNNTNYNVYAFMSGSTLTLEVSTTARATDTTNGHQIKSGDATRTLVGKIRTISTSDTADSVTQRYVINWFNRRPLQLERLYTTANTTTSTTPVEIGAAADRLLFLSWGEDAVSGFVQGYSINSGSTYSNSYCYMDGTTTFGGTATGGAAAGFHAAATFMPSEGNHYLSLFGSSGNSLSTATFEGSAKPSAGGIIYG